MQINQFLESLRNVIEGRKVLYMDFKRQFKRFCVSDNLWIIEVKIFLINLHSNGLVSFDDDFGGKKRYLPHQLCN